jgi:hypothetical protein
MPALEASGASEPAWTKLIFRDNIGGMNIEDIRQCCSDESVFLTAHGTIRLYDRRISYESVIAAIACGLRLGQWANIYHHFLQTR